MKPDAVRSEWWAEAVRFVGIEREGGLSDEGFLDLLLSRVPVGAVRTSSGWGRVESLQDKESRDDLPKV